jgi:hypothetical protein
VNGAVLYKADKDNPTFTGLEANFNCLVKFNGNAQGQKVSGLSKSDIGLSNVDNTSDASKPISTATQSALDLKANKDSPTLHGDSQRHHQEHGRTG